MQEVVLEVDVVIVVVEDVVEGMVVVPVLLVLALLEDFVEHLVVYALQGLLVAV